MNFYAYKLYYFNYRINFDIEHNDFFFYYYFWYWSYGEGTTLALVLHQNIRL